MSTRWRRLIAVNLLLSLILGGVGACGAELYARMTFRRDRRPTAGRYVDDDVLNHAFIPNNVARVKVHDDLPEYEFKTNGLGLRFDEPYQVKKPEGTYRIVFCGDSFVEGYAFEHSLPAQLQHKLSADVAARGRRLEVIHAGVGSYSPTLHYFALSEYLLDLQPDLVLLAIDATDARDDFNYSFLLYERDGKLAGVRATMTERLRSLRRNMAERLPFFSSDRWVAVLFDYSHLARYFWQNNALAYAAAYPEMIEVPAFDMRTGPPIFDIGEAKTREQVHASVQWVRRIDELVRSRSARLIVTMYPWREQIRNHRLKSYIRRYRRAAEKDGIPFHDATPSFEKLPDPEAAYLAGDVHFNYLGQKVWADSLVAFLKPHLLE